MEPDVTLFNTKEFVLTENLNALEAAYDGVKCNIAISGPRGVGKTVGLKWLYKKLRSEGKDVVYLDYSKCTVESLKSMQLQHTVILVDNAHLAELGHSEATSRVKRIIGAFSPLGFFAADTKHSIKFIYC